MHTQSGVAERFLNDVKTELAKLLLNPTKPVDGKVLIKKTIQSNTFLKKIGISRWQFTVWLKVKQIDRWWAISRDCSLIQCTTLRNLMQIPNSKPSAIFFSPNIDYKYSMVVLLNV